MPFLTRYLSEYLNLNSTHIAMFAVIVGAGSIAGSFTGGMTSGRFGFLKTMAISLILSSIAFLEIYRSRAPLPLAIWLFLAAFAVDAFRPALYIAVDAFVSTVSRARSLSLVRLSINLGFAAAPALGGMLISLYGYHNLMAWSGAAYLSSLCGLMYVASNFSSSDPARMDAESNVINSTSTKNFYYILLVNFLISSAYTQIFYTVPLYHQSQYKLTPSETGSLMSLNGILIFLIEMPLITFLSKKNADRRLVIACGAVVMGCGFLILLLRNWIITPIFSIVLITIAEILAFPFSDAIALESTAISTKGKRMALFTMGFGVANMFGSYGGLIISSQFGYAVNWLATTAFCCIASALCMLLSPRSSVSAQLAQST
jgi:predicted MFS family arabinose efflux permease